MKHRALRAIHLKNITLISQYQEKKWRQKKFARHKKARKKL
jgi:hypothetical protein